MYGAAVIAPIRADRAKVPVCPSCERVRPSRYAFGVYLQEVELVDWVMICGAAEEDEKHEEKAARHEDERDESEDASCKRWSIRRKCDG